MRVRHVRAGLPRDHRRLRDPPDRARPRDEPPGRVRRPARAQVRARRAGPRSRPLPAHADAGRHRFPGRPAALAGHWAGQLATSGCARYGRRSRRRRGAPACPGTDADADGRTGRALLRAPRQTAAARRGCGALLAVADLGRDSTAPGCRATPAASATTAGRSGSSPSAATGRPATARHRLDRLVTALRDAGLGDRLGRAGVRRVRRPTAPSTRTGWCRVRYRSTGGAGRPSCVPPRPAGRDIPSTYRPLSGTTGMWQRAAFDPALKQHSNAYRAGEPEFADRQRGGGGRALGGRRWPTCSTSSPRTPWAGQLVLRGSVTMSAWFGDAAREPGDLDFVVEPFTMGQPDRRGRATMLDGIVAALREPARRRAATPDRSGRGHLDLRAGRRASPGHPVHLAGVPDGTVQVDFVFNEQLPIPPVRCELAGVGVPMRAASPALSLAWKLMWLATDRYPQGKDLYDAVLLAEHTAVDLPLVRDLMRPELRDEADAFTAESVLSGTWTGTTSPTSTRPSPATATLETPPRPGPPPATGPVRRVTVARRRSRGGASTTAAGRYLAAARPPSSSEREATSTKVAHVRPGHAQLRGTAVQPSGHTARFARVRPLDRAAAVRDVERLRGGVLLQDPQVQPAGGARSATTAPRARDQGRADPAAPLGVRDVQVVDERAPAGVVVEDRRARTRRARRRSSATIVTWSACGDPRRPAQCASRSATTSPSRNESANAPR